MISLGLHASTSNAHRSGMGLAEHKLELGPWLQLRTDAVTMLRTELSAGAFAECSLPGQLPESPKRPTEQLRSLCRPRPVRPGSRD